MSKGKLEKIILDYIRRHSGTSYAELENLLDRLQHDYKGEYEARAGANPNIIFWGGWNKETLELITGLIKAGKIERTPCSAFIYTVDGAILKYPILKGDPTKAKSTKWLPVVFTAC